LISSASRASVQFGRSATGASSSGPATREQPRPSPQQGRPRHWPPGHLCRNHKPDRWESPQTCLARRKSLTNWTKFLRCRGLRCYAILRLMHRSRARAYEQPTAERDMSGRSCGAVL
jgi:hypothetical protein